MFNDLFTRVILLLSIHYKKNSYFFVRFDAVLHVYDIIIYNKL